MAGRKERRELRERSGSYQGYGRDLEEEKGDADREKKRGGSGSV